MMTPRIKPHATHPSAVGAAMNEAVDSMTVESASRTLQRALHLMMAMAALLLSFWLVTPSSRALADSDAAMASEVIRLVNIERTNAGVPPVREDPELAAAAAQRAREAAFYFSHTRLNGTKWLTVFEQFGIKAAYRGENLAFGQLSARSVVRAWMESSEHRANILDESFDRIAIGLQKRGGVLYWSQLFMREDAISPPEEEKEENEEYIIFIGGPVKPGRYARVIDRDLNVRATGSASATVVTVLDEGSALTVLEVHEGWAKIRVPDGTEGWASIKYLAG